MPKRRPPLTDKDGEVRELTREDFRGMRPVREAMPELIEAMAEFRRKLGRPKAEAPKVHIGFRLAADVVEGVKASGRGYNARVEQALRAAGFGAKEQRQASVKKASMRDATEALAADGVSKPVDMMADLKAQLLAESAAGAKAYATYAAKKRRAAKPAPKATVAKQRA
jgi:uncharacterized protein (DUF4415 family)